MNENMQENIPDEENDAPAPDPVTETVSKMRDLGLDPNAFVTLFMPVIEQMNRQSAENLRKEIQMAISIQAKQIGQQIVENINTETDKKLASMNQPAANVFDYPQATQSENVPAVAGRQSVDVNSLMPAILKMISGGSGSGNGMAESMKQMTETAKIFGTFYSELMAPMNSVKSQMMHDILAELTTLSKTGGTLPWEYESAPAPAPRTAVLNQEERQRRIDAMARKIRLTK